MPFRRSWWNSRRRVPHQADATTARTLGLEDADAVIVMDNASANTVTIPLNATVAFESGDALAIIQKGAGTTTITAVAGVTLNGVDGGSADLNGQYAMVSLIKTGTDEWVISGGFPSVA